MSSGHTYIKPGVMLSTPDDFEFAVDYVSVISPEIAWFWSYAINGKEQACEQSSNISIHCVLYTCTVCGSIISLF